ncbi:MAG TPA: hypothetical protein DHW64_10340 [Chitinophagaceae bacterium]|nr:hypothetical protein [Chitinophagaceae bacterium]
MKRWVMMICMLLLTGIMSAQQAIPIRDLGVTLNKTSNLIFPATILSIDRGSANIIVQKSTDFILRVKADTLFTDTTNLTVITSDGKLYSFLVYYDSSPTMLTIDLGAGEYLDKDTSMMGIVRKVIPQRNNMYGVRYSAGKVQVAVVGIYSTGKMLALKIRIVNHSSLFFSVGKIRMRLFSTNLPRRSPVHETEILPLLIEPSQIKLAYKEVGILTLLIPVQDFNPKQDLQISIHEKQGDRHLQMRITNRFLFSAPIIQ